jgi:solute carrier family 25 aspartate/glutamate transporter 12/13
LHPFHIIRLKKSVIYKLNENFFNRKPEGSQIEIFGRENRIESNNPDHLGGYKLAAVTFTGLENKFGLSFPRYSKVQ